MKHMRYWIGGALFAAILSVFVPLTAQNLGGIPAAIGTAVDYAAAFKVGGTLTPNSSPGAGVRITPTLKAGEASHELAGLDVRPTLAEYISGGAPDYFASIYAAAPTITSGAATNPAVGAALYLGAAGTGATANYSMYVATGGSGYYADADSLQVGGVKVPQAIEVTYSSGYTTGTSILDTAFFVANRAYQVTACREVHGTAGNDAGAVNLNVEKLTGTTAAGSGTQLFTDNTNAGVSLKGTANTVVAGTLTGTTASLQLAAGDRLGVNVTGTLTSVAQVQVTCQLKAI